MLYWILRLILLVVLRFLYTCLGGIRFEGREWVPRKGGVLITPNHISDADPTAVGLALPRACYFMAKEELFQIRLLGPFLRVMRTFPVRRYSADRGALARAERLLRQGEAVVIFPEGRLSEDGSLQELLPGALLVAQRTGVPIVPTIIEGTDRLIPYGQLMPRHAGRRIVIRFGPPVTFAELAGGQQGSEALRVAAQRLREILLELQQGQVCSRAGSTTSTPGSARASL